jgi:hypothetical protein
MLRDVGHAYARLVEPFLGPSQPPLILTVGSVIVIRRWRRNALGILAPSQALGLTSSGDVVGLALDLVMEGWPCPR